MGDLIDREMLRLQLIEMRKFDDKVGRTDWKYRCGICRVERLIREAPAVDAVEVGMNKLDRFLVLYDAIKSHTYICDVCGGIAFPDVMLQDDEYDVEQTVSEIRGGIGNKPIKRHVCNKCYERLLSYLPDEIICPLPPLEFVQPEEVKD